MPIMTAGKKFFVGDFYREMRRGAYLEERVGELLCVDNPAGSDAGICRIW